MRDTLKRVGTLAVLAAVVGAIPAAAQLDLPRPSPSASVMQRVGLTDITIAYSRPGVKNRQIWGELVPWGEMWRTGANEATTISFTGPVDVAGTALPAGTYALFTIPGESEWTVVLNSDAEQWGTYNYDPSKDVLRIKVRPEKAPYTEWMLFTFRNLSEDAATVTLDWKETRIGFPVKVDVVDTVMANARAAMVGLADDDWRTPYRAAVFAIGHGVHLDEAGQWLDRSIAIRANYPNLSAKARLLADQGEYAAAVAMGKKAVQAGQSAERPVDVTELQQLIEEWQKKSM